MMLGTDQRRPYGDTEREARDGWPSSPAEVFKSERSEHIAMTEDINVSRTTALEGSP